VAIRTVVLDADGGDGIGSGIVADSKADSEFESACSKPVPDPVGRAVRPIETIRYERERASTRSSGTARPTSAAYFGYPFARGRACKRSTARRSG
jgi:hypothetical protein